MALTKDEVSGLNSLIDRVVHCEKEVHISEQCLLDARRGLDNFLHYQQFPLKDGK